MKKKENKKIKLLNISKLSNLSKSIYHNPPKK